MLKQNENTVFKHYIYPPQISKLWRIKLSISLSSAIVQVLFWIKFIWNRIIFTCKYCTGTKIFIFQTSVSGLQELNYFLKIELIEKKTLTTIWCNWMIFELFFLYATPWYYFVNLVLFSDDLEETGSRPHWVTEFIYSCCPQQPRSNISH